MNDLQRAFTAVLEKKGVTLVQLAEGTNLSESSIMQLVNKQVISRRRIRKIENFLGVPVWSPVEDFQRINRASALFGADAVLTAFYDLRSRAIALRLPNARLFTSKEELIAAVLSHVTNTDLPTSANEKARN